MADHHTFASAARWSFAISAGQYGTLLALNLLLARMLGPEAFGLVAMATVYVLFVQLLLQQGMMPAIIQRRDLQPAHLDTAFILVMAAALILTLGSIALSGWWADVNDLPDLQPLIVALSFLLPLRGLSLVQEALLRRQLDFRPLALRTGLAMSGGAFVALVLAVLGAGVWALVSQQLVTATIEVVVLWRVGRWRPRLRLSRARASELLGFSGGSFLASVGVFTNTRADALLTGFFFGPVAVGWYRLGTRLTTSVIDLASRSLEQAALPALARVQHQPDELRARAVHVLHLCALTSVPVLGVLAAATVPLLQLLGPEWEAAAPSVQVLCWWAATASVMLMTGAVLQATGRPYLLAALQWISAVVSCAAFVAVGTRLRNEAVTTQVMGIALSRAIIYTTLLLAMNILVLRLIVQVALPQQARSVLPAAGAGLVAYLVGSGALSLLGDPGPLLGLVVAVGSAGLAAVAALLLVDPLARELVTTLRLRLSPATPTTTGLDDAPSPSSPAPLHTAAALADSTRP